MRKATGITRPVDSLGRVAIPVELRRILEWEHGDRVEIFVSDNGEVILRKYVRGCAACGEEKRVYSEGNLLLCEKCIRRMAAATMDKDWKLAT